ncbi:hypothetical protein ES705_36452 [subsurface metagenome]
MSLPEDLSQFTALVDIIARLRAPDGCPWDKKQTHASLRKDLLEECYEVLEALDEGNADKLCDELGDLLMPEKQPPQPHQQAPPGSTQNIPLIPSW